MRQKQALLPTRKANGSLANSALGEAQLGISWRPRWHWQWTSSLNLLITAISSHLAISGTAYSSCAHLNSHLAIARTTPSKESTLSSALYQLVMRAKRIISFTNPLGRQTAFLLPELNYHLPAVNCSGNLHWLAPLWLHKWRLCCLNKWCPLLYKLDSCHWCTVEQQLLYMMALEEGSSVHQLSTSYLATFRNITNSTGSIDRLFFFVRRKNLSNFCCWCTQANQFVIWKFILAPSLLNLPSHSNSWNWIQFCIFKVSWVVFVAGQWQHSCRNTIYYNRFDFSKMILIWMSPWSHSDLPTLLLPVRGLLVGKVDSIWRH